MKSVILALSMFATAMTANASRVNNGYGPLYQKYACVEQTDPRALVSEIHYLDVYKTLGKRYLLDVYKKGHNQDVLVDVYQGTAELDENFFPYVKGIRLFNTLDQVELLTTELPMVTFAHLTIQNEVINFTCEISPSASQD